WGMIWAGTTESEPLPNGVEAQLSEFSELVAIAVSNAESRDRLRRLADQQAALRRVATLAAEGASSAEVFSAVAHEAARILDVPSASIVRSEPDATSVVAASFNDSSFEAGSRWPDDPLSLNAFVRKTARPARIDDYSDVDGPVAAAARASGVQTGIAVPIVVNGRVWGMLAAGMRKR